MPSRGIPETPAPRSTRLARDGGGGGRAAADAAVVDQAQALMPALGEQAVDLERVDEAAEEVRDIPIEMPRLVVLQAALVALEQHPRSARALDLLGDRQLPGERVPGELTIAEQ